MLLSLPEVGIIIIVIRMREMVRAHCCVDVIVMLSGCVATSLL